MTMEMSLGDGKLLSHREGVRVAGANFLDV